MAWTVCVSLDAQTGRPACFYRFLPVVGASPCQYTPVLIFMGVCILASLAI